MSGNNSNLVVIDNKRLVGTTVPDESGLVALKIDDQVITHLPLNRSANDEFCEYTMLLSATLVRALPKDYTLSAELPSGELVKHPNKSPLGQGDGTLLDKIESGYLVSAKGGFLFKPPASQEQWKEKILDAYDSGLKILKEIDGISDIFIAYGSLLGAIRDGDFISYDNDFDVAYLVDANTPEEAAAQFHRVFNELRDRNYDVSFGGHIGNFHLKMPDLPALDIFLMYYSESYNELRAFCITVECEKDMILPLQEFKFRGRTVLVPNKSELLLESTYGKNWNIPDPHFQWNLAPKTKQTNLAYRQASKVIVGEN